MFGRVKAAPIDAIDCEEDRGDVYHGDKLPHLANVLDSDLTAAREFKIPTGPEERLVSINDPATSGAELLRVLATRLRLAQKRHPIKKLLVTSAVPGEGKTLLAANLAITLALQLKRVLLIDGDLRSASLSRRFDIVDESFVATWSGDGPHRLPLRRKAEGLPLWVVPAGKPAELPGNILQSAEFASALGTSEQEFDWIVMDSTPLVPFSDAGLLASLADAVILVTRRGVTPKTALRDAMKSFDKSKIIATILNCANVTSHKYYRDYYARVRKGLPAYGDTDGPEPRVLNPK
ncbi:MAG TPA: CpsD/CapB family tyrosine-protein kinase [Candidatus Angelobacter sp.]|jgi:capsular exopolysaccharide synthesis family protein|nr:CpsD/CapB family tyrosine-protein kinase [Candidatus Angelobacter sp.]